MIPNTFPSSSPASPSRTVLVTGASGGIGRRLCLAFARDGFWVGVHYFRRRHAAEDTLAELTAAGGEGALFQADIRSRDAVQAMVDDLQCRRGRLDVLLCVAGIAGSHLVVRFPEEDWQRIIETNLSGTYRSMTAAAAVMTTGGGSILVIGSYAGLHGTSGQGAYAASKAGLIGLVQTAAREWGPYNIRVNLICPGWQLTNLAGESYPTADELQDHVLGRVSNLNDVSMTICRLAQLPDVSGQVWNLDSRIV
ncbi:MAG TPA: beta-ketoacyl-ACP reductase [Nitrospira sp.]|nr:beta-ketoacyl-ACP reductase [Nitrospira sp.]